MTRIRFSFALLMMVAVVAMAGTSASAQYTCIKFNTTLESLNLTGGPFPIPLASDPTNSLGDSVEGYGFVDSEVTVTLSASPPTTGMAFAFQEGGQQAANAIEQHQAGPGQQNSDFGQQAGGQGAAGAGAIPCGDEVIDPDVLDGEQFIVDSFFDVFFDITVTDVDNRPGRDYAGQPDGASFTLTGNGPASMQSFYLRIFDADAPTFGLIPPPEADPYIGHFDIVIPLGADINGNAATEPLCATPNEAQCDDKIVFTLAAHSAGDENRTFIVLPNGTVLEEFDSAAFLDGAVIDTFADPPFVIGAQLPNGQPDPAAFGGPTTASSVLVNPLLGPPAVPLMKPWGLAALGILLVSFVAWRLARTRQAQV